MTQRCKAWEIRKTHNSDYSKLQAHQYKGVTILISQDHTQSRLQRTILGVSGRMPVSKLKARANDFVDKIGYTLGTEMTDFSVFLDGRDAQSNRRYWAVGKNRNGDTPDETLEAVSPTAELDIGKLEESNKRLFFPESGTGIIIAAKTNRRNWALKIWGYGKDRKDVAGTVREYTNIVTDAKNASAVSRSKGFTVGVISGILALLSLMLGYASVIVPNASVIMCITFLSVSGMGLISWWNSPLRRSFRRRRVPAAVLRALASNWVFMRKMFFRKNPTIIQMLESTNPGMCADVPSNPNILPDLGGVAIGKNGIDDLVRVPDSDRYTNITVVGAPGTGKTTLMLHLIGGDMARMKQGHKHTAIWFETKQDGAERLKRVAEKVGVEPLVFIPGSPEGPQLRWLDWSDTKAASGTLTEAFVTAFETGSIQEQSRDVFASLFHMASLVWPSHLKALGEDKVNLMRTAWLLSGGGKWKTAMDLLDQVKRHSHNREEYDEAYERIGVYYEMPERDRENRMAPARNKLGRLIDFPAWTLDLNRPVYSWHEVLDSQRPVIIDISKFELSRYSEETIRIMLPIAFFTFWATAQFHCHDWYEKRQSVSLYCDEASNLPYNSGKILSQISTQGRSHGVSLVLGAQGWSQLSEVTQQAFRSAGNKCFFSQHDSESATSLAKDFDTSSYFDYNSLTRLQPFETLAVLKIGAQRFGPVLLQTLKDEELEPRLAWKERLNA